MTRGSVWMSRVSAQQLPDVAQLAVDTLRTIALRPSENVVILRRDPDTAQIIELAPQTVRLEPFQNVYGGKELKDPMAIISRQYVVLLGYKGHPTIPDTDLQRADQFFYQGLMWEVVEFIPTIPGRLLASCDITP